MREPIDIVIYVSGGVVTGVSTGLANTDGLRVVVADFDNGEQATPEDVEAGGYINLSNEPGRTMYASVGFEMPACAPEEVLAIMQAVRS